MKHTLWRFRKGVGLLLALSMGITSLLAQEATKYHTNQELTQALQSLVQKHRNLASLSEIATTIGNQKVWLLEIGNGSSEARSERPALLIVANLEAHQVIGSELALHMATYFLENYTANEKVKEALGQYTLYIVPRMNPDGVADFFAPLKTGTATNRQPHDDDNDGRTDEDNPDDLNRDGLITMMRVLDSDGDYMLEAEGSRLLKKADASKGERGVYALYWEGIDNDGDNFYNEDAIGGIDLNRNFQHEYPYYQRGAGKHMVSEQESRGLMDFVIAHRNIALVFTFGESDNLIVPPNNKGEIPPANGLALFDFANKSIADANKVGIFRSSTPSFRRGGGNNSTNDARGRPPRKPEVTINKNDLPYYTTISEKYKEITGIKQQPPLRKPEGAFFQYGYFQYGVPSFSTPGWGISTLADSTNKGKGKNSKSLDAKLLAWLEQQNVKAFVDWQPYTHPTLGEVEIGGWHPYAPFNPPASLIPSLAEKNAQFALYLTTLFPKAHIVKTEVINHEGGIFSIKATIENNGFLPMTTQHGIVSRSVKPTMVQLEIPPENLLSGAAKTSFISNLEGSGNQESFEWLIKGKKGETVTLKVVAQKGGSESASIRLE